MSEARTLESKEIGDLMFAPSSTLMCMSSGKKGSPGKLSLKCELQVAVEKDKQKKDGAEGGPPKIAAVQLEEEFGAPPVIINDPSKIPKYNPKP